MTRLTDAGTLGGHDGLSLLDLGTYFLTIDEKLHDEASSMTLAYHSTFVHENSHWIRFHGSTLGAALTALQVASQEIIYDGFARLSPNERHILLNQRKKGVPIFSDKQPNDVGSQQYEEMCASWYADRIGYHLLLDSRAVLPAPRANTSINLMQPRQALGYSLCDAHLVSSRVLGTADMQLISRLPEYGWTPRIIETSWGRLTAHSLFECAATLDEFVSMSGFMGLPKELGINAETKCNKLLNRMLETSYGIPLKLFWQITGKGLADLTSSISVLMALIDYALNPPLPPAITYATLETIEWEELDPACRFVAACSAVSRISQLSRLPNPAELRCFHDELSSLLGWHSLFLYDGSLATVASSYLPTVKGQDTSLGTLSYKYPGMLGYVQSRFWALRLQYPEVISHFGFIPDINIDVSTDLIFDSAGQGWFMAPLQRLADNRAGFSSGAGWDDSRLSTYMTSLAMHILTGYLINGVGPIPSGVIPLGANERDFWRDICDGVAGQLYVDGCLDDLIPSE